MQLRDQRIAQHGVRIGGGPRAAGDQLRAQLLHHRGGHGGAEVGTQQGVFDVLPGVLVEVAAAEQPQHALAQRVLRSGQPPAQPVQPALGGGDGVQRGLGGCNCLGRGDRRRRLGLDGGCRGLDYGRLGLDDGWFRELDIGNGALGGVPRDGGVVADDRDAVLGTAERDPR